MAKKLRTGFELPFSNASGSDQSKIGYSEMPNLVFGGLVDGWIIGYRDSQDTFNFNSASISSDFSAMAITQTTSARTLSNGTRGCVLSGLNNLDERLLSFDISQFSSGIYLSFWARWNDAVTHRRLFAICDGTNSFDAYLNKSTNDLRLAQGSSSTLRDSSAVTFVDDTWYFVEISITNAGVITATFNGASVTYSTGISFSSFTKFFSCLTTNWASAKCYIDDLAINDGSGASDNGLPNSIRGYNFFDAATLNTNIGFSQVGGSGVLANLQDGDDATRVSAQADLSYLDFSLPTLSGTGMSETAANFANIQAINIYGRQIEATKASSVLKAKITDTVAVVDREENLSLPLTVGNDSLFYPDDDSAAWVLANLDSGDFDFRVTFDKP